MLFTELKTQNNGTTSGCAVRHTASMPSSCSEQSELIPDPTTFDIKGTMHPSGITQSVGSGISEHRIL